jgi:hypothetical protein
MKKPQGETMAVIPKPITTAMTMTEMIPSRQLRRGLVGVWVAGGSMVRQV